MPPKKAGWVSGRLPAKLPQQQSPIGGGPQSLKRIQRLKQQQTMGLPLAEVLRRHHMPTAKSGGFPYVAGGLLMICGALSLSGIISGNLSWLFIGMGAGLIAVIMILASRQRANDSLPDKLAIDAEKLDRVLERYASELPSEAILLLVKIKETLGIAMTSTLSLDDTLFAREMVARYIPDACQHYCDLKSISRSAVQISADRTAEDSLLEQLQIMETRLSSIHGAIIAEKADMLVHHEKFLRTKQ
jgi:hypothetical protein